MWMLLRRFGISQTNWKKVNEWTNICHRDHSFFSSKHLAYSNWKKDIIENTKRSRNHMSTCVFIFNFRASPSRNKSSTGVWSGVLWSQRKIFPQSDSLTVNTGLREAKFSQIPTAVCLLSRHAMNQRVHWDVHEYRDPLNYQYPGWVQQQLSHCQFAWVLKTFSCGSCRVLSLFPPWE